VINFVRVVLSVLLAGFCAGEGMLCAVCGLCGCDDDRAALRLGGDCVPFAAFNQRRFGGTYVWWSARLHKTVFPDDSVR